MKSYWREISLVILGAMFAGAGYQVLIISTFVTRNDLVQEVSNNSPWVKDKTYVMSEISYARSSADKIENLMIETVRISTKLDNLKIELSKLQDLNESMLKRLALDKETK